jgi:enamine deaminase RidA (YjgF/YER057c/UK114 family)
MVGMMKATHLQPAGLPSNPAFAQGVSVEGPARTIYVGGQNGMGADGTSAGNDAGSQTRQALENVRLVLAEAGAELTDIVYWRIALVQGASLEAGFGAFQEVWGERGEPPAISVDVVAGLANPSFLVEITAVAVVAA